MNKKIKAILTYGAILSLPMILMSVLAYVFDFGQSKAFGWISIIIFIATLVLIQRHLRENYYEGFVRYGKLLGMTLLILTTASLLMFIYTFLFYEVIAPEQMDKMLEIARANLYENQQLSGAQIKQSLEFMTKYVFTSLAMSLTAMGSTFGQGLVFSLITGIFIKKNQDGFTEVMKEINDTEE